MDGIVLLAKQPDVTSFTSLNNVKKALDTKKVGHTGTLDSFAQGLMVVCVGRLTRLAGNITEFDKTYEAIIKFGEETDTLEYTGNIIKKTVLPDLASLKNAIEFYKGIQMQRPPVFSAIHIDGERASDLARKGITAEINLRQINVYKAELKDVMMNDENKVLACKIIFSVSKGTYIRALARDIAEKCGSSGHLIGLYRTGIGSFNIEQAAGFNLLSENDFSIENCLKFVEVWKQNEILKKQNQAEKSKEHKKYIPTEKDEIIKKEIKEKIQDFEPSIAEQCGFEILHLKNTKAEEDFKNGRPIFKQWFEEYISTISCNKLLSVFTKDNRFCGLIIKTDEKHLKYQFVLN